MTGNPQNQLSNPRRKHGQALVEFALVLPILLLVILGVIDFGRVLLTYAMASSALRDAVRQAEIIGYESSTIPVYTDCDAMREAATRVFFATSQAITIRYEKADAPGTYIDCPVGAVIDPDDLENGDMLQIENTASVNFITPFLNNMLPSLTFKFRGQRTIIKEIPLGIADSLVDTDYDGLADLWEDEHFGDNDGVVETSDLGVTGSGDPDADGCNNGCEETRNTDPNDEDTDGDTLLDGDEIYLYLTNPLLMDTDGDNVDDNDEINGTFGYVTDPTLQDTDGDGINDGDEFGLGLNPNSNDSDGDTLLDAQELAGVTGADGESYITDPTSSDSDGDSLTDPQELALGLSPISDDTDGDGVKDNVEIDGSVGYVTLPNNDDTDFDNLIDGDEIFGIVSPITGLTYFTNPLLADTDGEGLLDGDEVLFYGTDPTRADPDADFDGLPDNWEQFYFGDAATQNGSDDSDFDGADGCTNICEFQNATNPAARDTEGDGLSDGDEINGVLVGSTTYFSDPRDADSDNDNLTDLAELTGAPVTDPSDADTDNDLLKDGVEVNGILAPNGQTYFTNPTTADTDSDTLTDYNEINLTHTNPTNADSDSDGINDNVEVAGSNGYTTQPNDADTDDDGMEDGDEVNGFVGPISGDTYTTDPTLEDTDGDHFNDGDEVNLYGTDPTTPDSPGTISIDDIVVVEGDSGTVDAIFTVTLSPATPFDVSVQFSSANGTATSSDFGAVMGTVNFAPMDTSETITVQINGDTLDEDDETFSITLSNATFASIADGQGTATITDNDASPTITINDVSATEGNIGQSAATFTVTLSAVSGRSVTLDYAATAATATAGSDFSLTNGTVTFTPGDTSETVAVLVSGDVIDELDQTFNVSLSNPTNASIVDNLGVGTISDDDAPPTITIADLAVKEPNNNVNTNFSFTVTVTGLTENTITLTYQTANSDATGTVDSAANGVNDYVIIPITNVNIVPGVTSLTIPVTIKGDNSNENPDEHYFVNLTAATNATISDSQALGWICKFNPATATTC